MRTYGRLWYVAHTKRWGMSVDPHVAIMAKRIFAAIPVDAEGRYSLPGTRETAENLEWFMQRYPLAIDGPDGERLASDAEDARQSRAQAERIVSDGYTPRNFDLVLPPREYQWRAAELLLHSENGLLLADDVGLGKTMTAICTFREPAALPAVVVCPAHLCRQWAAEITKFAPDLVTHILTKATPYDLPRRFGPPDVLITSYHKIFGWAEVLAERSNAVIFDEGQELRHNKAGSEETKKYQGARQIAHGCRFKMALTATPIYNYGGEIFNLMQILAPGFLGERDEFVREWCIGGDKPSLKDPAAFGSFLREHHLMLRRTRKDVQRELPAVQRITHQIDCDSEALDDIESKAEELARILLASDQRGIDKMQAAGELDLLLRQATGIGKAKFSAAFVELLLQNDEPVVLFGWHRAVYEIWLEQLKEWRPAMYTGSESPAAKTENIRRFMDGETNLLIMSLRSGTGVDGLQKRCRTAVFGELDWSPGVHGQNIGRLHRDGQPDPVTAYFLLSTDGSDPIIAEMLGFKRTQIEGLIGESTGRGGGLIEQTDHAGAIRKLAEKYLAKSNRRKS